MYPTATLARRDSFNAARAAELAAISYRQLDYWLRIGMLTATVQAHGSGSRRVFTLHDVCLLRLLGRLRALGCPTDVCTEVAAMLHDLPLDQWVGQLVVHPTGRVQLDAPVVGAGWVVDLADSTEPKEA